MKKMFLIFLLTQLLISCASHHHDRFPSSVDQENEAYYQRNPRFRR